ncbi:MAG: PAS domain-containing protein [Chloroflexota bacterium]|nr:MAG: PAS domain-containing protein [Chloroflexota bacterium]
MAKDKATDGTRLLEVARRLASTQHALDKAIASNQCLREEIREKDRALAEERRRAKIVEARVQSELEAQRALLEMIIANVPAGIVVCRGPDLVYELINKAAQKMIPSLGMRALGKTYAEVFPETAAVRLPELQQVLRTGEPVHYVDEPDRVRRSPEGPLEQMYVTSTVARLLVSEEQENALIFLFLDTTEQVRTRKKVEELAAVAQQRASALQAVIDNMVDAVFVCDAEGNITLINESGWQLLSPTGDDVARKTLADIPDLGRLRHLDGRPVAAEETSLARALSGQLVVGQQAVGYDRSTQRDIYVRTSAAPIRDEKGQIVGAVAVVRDVTELTELDRLKDQFISVAAHELKTPVAMMKGYAQVLLRGGGALSPPHRSMLEAIDRGANRIDNVVQELLDISRLHAGSLELTMEQIDLSELARIVVDRMALTAQKHYIQLVKAEPVVVQGDHDRLEQVLLNLLSNATKYSPQGSEVDVAVTVQGNEAVVSVRDHGVGIPKDKQARIFQRFYSAHIGTPYDFGGMGVGLYISKGIIVRHGGRMWFEGDEHEGATFYFSLPLS